MSQGETLELLVRTQQEDLLQQQALNASLTESNRHLTNRVNELLSQIAWLNRQLFGRRSEKLARLDPNQPSLFDGVPAPQQTAEDIESAREVAVEQISVSIIEKKKERHQRRLLENLPVIEVVIDPEGIDTEKYKRIGEERTRTLEFEPGRLYVKEIVRPKYGLKDNTALPDEGRSSVKQMADREDMSHEQRRGLREELATPILASLEQWMKTAYPTVLPRSRMGQAIAYSYTLWPRMKNYLKEGRLMIDNNLAENAIRPIAISRKNFLFCGNHQAAEHTAIICSLLASCKGLAINPRDWLNDVLTKLPYYCQPGKTKNLKELLPTHWQQTDSNKLQ